jgi:hypothetical protein
MLIPDDGITRNLGSMIINYNNPIPIRCSTIEQGPTKLKRRPSLRGILKPWAKPTNPRNLTDIATIRNSLYVKPPKPGIKEVMAEDEVSPQKKKITPKIDKES